MRIGIHTGLVVVGDMGGGGYRDPLAIVGETPNIAARVQGIDDARETAFSTVESVRAGKEQILTYMATIGTLGPMIGLVGTVFGMIRTFMVLGQGGSPEPSKLATGISEALAITLLGIALAVPAIFFHAFFRNRLIRISNECSAIADDLITQMHRDVDTAREVLR